MNNPLSIRTQNDDTGEHKLDWNKVLDLGIKVVTLITLIYCVKHGINMESTVQKVEHKAAIAEEKAVVASNLVAEVAVKVESNTVQSIANRNVASFMAGEAVVSQAESQAVEQVANQSKGSPP